MKKAIALVLIIAQMCLSTTSAFGHGPMFKFARDNGEEVAFPKDIQTLILSELPPENLVKIQRVNKAWFHAASTELKRRAELEAMGESLNQPALAPYHNRLNPTTFDYISMSLKAGMVLCGVWFVWTLASDTFNYWHHDAYLNKEVEKQRKAINELQSAQTFIGHLTGLCRASGVPESLKDSGYMMLIPALMCLGVKALATQLHENELATLAILENLSQAPQPVWMDSSTLRTLLYLTLGLTVTFGTYLAAHKIHMNKCIQDRGVEPSKYISHFKPDSYWHLARLNARSTYALDLGEITRPGLLDNLTSSWDLGLFTRLRSLTCARVHEPLLAPHLSGFTRLVNLMYAGEKYSDQHQLPISKPFFNNIVGLPRIEHLELADLALDEPHVRALSNLKRLSSLKLIHVGVPLLNAADSGPLQSLVHLKSIYFDRCKRRENSAAGLNTFQELLASAPVEEMTFIGRHDSNYGAPIWYQTNSKTYACPRLHTLILDQYNFFASPMDEHLYQPSMIVNQLTKLVIRNVISHAGAGGNFAQHPRQADYDQFASLRGLRHFAVSYFGSPSAALRPFVAQDQLTSLDTNEYRLNDEALAQIGSMVRLKHLRICPTIGWHELAPAAYEQLANLHDLQTLDLGRKKISHATLSRIIQLPELTSLLVNVDGSDGGFVSLSAYASTLTTAPQLKKLTLRCRIAPERFSREDLAGFIRQLIEYQPLRKLLLKMEQRREGPGTVLSMPIKDNLLEKELADALKLRFGADVFRENYWI